MGLILCKAKAGSVYGWGSNSYGEATVPADVNEAVDFAAGEYFSMALLSGGEVRVWGRNSTTTLTLPIGLNGVTAISAGSAHALALKSDGTVIAWGSNTAGQATVPSGLSSVVAIAAGARHSLALLTDGTIVGWGQNTSKETTIPQMNGAVAIDAGADHSLALLADGTVMAWGGNILGQCNVPAGLNNVVKIAAGYFFSAALKSDGSVVVWGKSDFSLISGAAAFGGGVDIAAGANHILGLKPNGSLEGWGYGASGQLSIPPGVAFGKISAGLSHNVGTASGQASPLIIGGVSTIKAAPAGSWGTPHPLHYKLPIGGNPTSVSVEGLPNGVSFNQDNYTFTGEPTSEGAYDLLVSATNDLGIVSRTIRLIVSGEPLILENPPTVIQRGDQSLLIKARATQFSATGLPSGVTISQSDGVISGLFPSGSYEVVLTVSNAFGSLDYTWRFDVPLPANVAFWGAPRVGLDAVKNVANAIKIVTQNSLTNVLTAEGTVIGWGGSNAADPVGLVNIADIAIFGGASYALKEDGTVVTWTSPTSFASVPELSDVVQIDGDESTLAALDRYGRIWSKTSTVPFTASPSSECFTGMALGGGYILGLKADGTVKHFTDNASVPAVLTEVTQVAAGNGHFLALKRDGTVVGWGTNQYGQANPPVGLTNVVKVLAKGNYSYALKRDGTLVSWGRSTDGNLSWPTDKRFSDIALGSNYVIGMMMSGESLAATMGSRKLLVVADGALSTPSSHFSRWVTSDPAASLTVTKLPPGLAFSASSKQVFGRATALGSYKVEFVASNSYGETKSTIEFVVGVMPRLDFSLPEILPLGSSQFQVSGLGSRFQASGLPSRMQLDEATGLLTGWADPGPYSVTFTATNAFGSVSQVWNFKVPNYIAWGTSLPTGPPQTELGELMACSSGARVNALLTTDGIPVSLGSGLLAPPDGLDNVVAIASAYRGVYALDSTGRVHQWNATSSGTTQITNAIALDANTESVTGGDELIALCRDGTVRLANNGILFGKSNEPLPRLTKIKRGYRQEIIGIKFDGTVQGWSSNLSPISIPQGLREVVSVACGDDYYLALLANGRVVAWGATAIDRYAPPTDLSNVVAIDCQKNGRSIALKADGSVVTWGATTDTVAPALRHVVDVSSSSTAHLAIAANAEQAPLIISEHSVITEALGASQATPWFHYRIRTIAPASNFSATGLPDGLSCDGSTGVISGAATQMGSFDVVLSATNAHGTRTRSLKIEVLGLPRLYGTLKTFLFPVEQSLAFGVESQSAFALNLPPGLTLDPTTKLISGRPDPGVYQAKLIGITPYGQASYDWSVNVPSFSYSVGWRSEYNGPLVGAERGDNHAITLDPYGNVIVWGSNTYGQKQIPSTVFNVVQVAAGADHSLVLRSDGKIIAWGRSGFQSSVPSPFPEVVSISANRNYNLALFSSGKVFSWGIGAPPNLPADLPRLVAISAGEIHALGLTTQGTVVGWGSNASGQLNIPANLSRVVSIRAMGNASYAILDDGAVVGWGQASPIPAGLPPVRAVAPKSGNSGVDFLLRDGRIYGDSSLTDVMGVSAKDGSTFFVGKNYAPPVISSPSTLLTEVDGLLPSNSFFWHQIVASGRPTEYLAEGLPEGLVLDQATGVISGRATTVGRFGVLLGATNAYGTTRMNIIINVLGGAVLQTLPQWISVVDSTIPWRVLGRDFRATGLPPGLVIDPLNGSLSGRAAAGKFQAVIHFNDFEKEVEVPWNVTVTNIVAWGKNDKGQLNIPPGTGKAVKIAAGDNHTLALMEDGSVVAWGSNTYGQCNVQAMQWDIIDIAAGKNHSIGLRRSGVATCAGDNRSGQCSVDIPGLVSESVLAGWDSTVLLNSAGRVRILGGHSSMDASGFIGVADCLFSHEGMIFLKERGTTLFQYSQLGEYTDINDAVQFVGRKFHLALRRTGDVEFVDLFNSFVHEAIDMGPARQLAATDEIGIVLQRDRTIKERRFVNSDNVWPAAPPLTNVHSIAAGVAHAVALVDPERTPGHFTLPLKEFLLRKGQAFVSDEFGRVAQADYETTQPLPSGLALNASSGAFEGTLTLAGVSKVNIVCTNGIHRSERPYRFLVFNDLAGATNEYDRWKLEKLANQALKAPLEDADADGDVNLLEFATGSDPSNSSSLTPYEADSSNFRGEVKIKIRVPIQSALHTVWQAEFDTEVDFQSPEVINPTLTVSPDEEFVEMVFQSSHLRSGTRFGRLRVSLPQE